MKLDMNLAKVGLLGAVIFGISGCGIPLELASTTEMPADMATLDPEPSVSPEPVTPVNRNEPTGKWSVCVNSENESQYPSAPFTSGSLRLFSSYNGSNVLTQQVTLYGSSDCTGEATPVNNSGSKLTGTFLQSFSMYLSNGTYEIKDIGAPTGFIAITETSLSGDVPRTYYMNESGTQICRMASESWEPDPMPTTWEEWVEAAEASDFVADPTTGECFNSTTASATPFTDNLDSHYQAVTATGGSQSLTGLWNSCRNEDSYSGSIVFSIDSDSNYKNIFALFAASDCAGDPAFVLQDSGHLVTQSLSQPTGWFPFITNPTSAHPVAESFYVSGDGKYIYVNANEDWTPPDPAPSDWDSWKTAASAALMDEFFDDPSGVDDENIIRFSRISGS